MILLLSLSLFTAIALIGMLGIFPIIFLGIVATACVLSIIGAAVFVAAMCCL